MLKNKKYFKLIIKHILIILFLAFIEIFLINKFFNLTIVNDNTRILIYFLFILPLILLYLIIFFIVKFFFIRYPLRRANKFQTRLMIFFILVSIIPIIPLTFISNAMLNRSIEILLSQNIDKSLQLSLNFINTYLNKEKENLLHFTGIIAGDKFIKYAVIFENDSRNYTKGVAKLANRYNLDFITILNKKGKILVNYQRKVILKNFFNKDLYENTIKGKVEYRLQKEVIDKKEYEYIEYFYPIIDNNNIIGVVITGKFLVENFTDDANTLARALQAYKQIELYKKPLVKGITSFIVIIITLIVLFISIIVSYYISKGVTEPIRKLLEGTKAVAEGNLDFKIEYESHDEIKLLINAFNQMMRELKANKQALLHTQRLAAWRDIARRIAHEIKNPLTPIKLSSERLLRKYGSEDFEEVLKKSVKTIIEEVDRLQNLINEFSNFARTPHLNLEIENLNFIVVETLNIFSGIQNISIKTKLEKNLPPLNLDKKRIKEVLINLINNAIDALKDRKDGEILIKTYTRENIFGRFVCLEVSDNGPGISEDIKDKLFEPYFTTKKEGTGLGLSIVDKIVTEHHGKIKYESDKNGTRFIIEFPL